MEQGEEQTTPLHLSQLVIPHEAENLASSGFYEIQPADYQLFVRLPKVCWIRIYQLLDTASLFTSQRVCKHWRNLINQPIVWADRSRREELWLKSTPAASLGEPKLPMRQHLRAHLRAGGMVAPGAPSSGSDEDAAAAIAARIHDDPTEIYGSENVAAMKRLCKAVFIKRALMEQHFNPQNRAVATLLESAATASEEMQESLWAEALELEECGQTYFDRARHYEQMEEYEKSIRDYECAVKICPYDHNIRTRLGLTYHKQNNLQMALRNYLTTAALCPWYQLAWNNAGSIFFNTGLYEQAEKCFSRCISLDNSASIAYNNRGLCHFLAGDGDKAVADFTTAYCLNEHDRTARANRAAAYILVGNLAAAVEDCVAELAGVGRQPSSDAVSSPYLHKHLGHAYKLMGQLEKAVEALRFTIELKSDYRQAYDLLAQCLTEMGNLEEARKIAIAGQEYKITCGNNETIFQYFLK